MLSTLGNVYALAAGCRAACDFLLELKLVSAGKAKGPKACRCAYAARGPYTHGYKMEVFLYSSNSIKAKSVLTRMN